MKRLIVLAALIATPAVAQDAKPPVWVMTIQLKASSFSASYQSEERCKEAVKVITPHLKKLGRADCLPVLQQ